MCSQNQQYKIHKTYNIRYKRRDSSKRSCTRITDTADVSSDILGRVGGHMSDKWGTLNLSRVKWLEYKPKCRVTIMGGHIKYSMTTVLKECVFEEKIRSSRREKGKKGPLVHYPYWISRAVAFIRCWCSVLYEEPRPVIRLKVIGLIFFERQTAGQKAQPWPLTVRRPCRR